MRFPSAPRATIVALLALGFLSCVDAPTTVKPALTRGLRRASANGVPDIVVSQVYGGGGNSGATLRNDFIELFNPGTAAIDVTGWSVQYASSAGTTWQTTALSGSIPAGGYYLVQEANGTGGTTNLPTPDAIGAIPMSGTNAKVWLSRASTAFAGACPTGADVVDAVVYGSSTSNCFTANTPGLGNTTAAIRGGAGCTYTGNLTADFTASAPTPRNSASPKHLCDVPGQAVAVSVSPASAEVTVGETVVFTAVAKDADSNAVSTSFTWSSDGAAATIADPSSGVITGASLGGATITATAGNGVTGSAHVSVIAPVVTDVVISQVYGGGGNSGAPYRNDYIELYNRGASDVSLNGWAVQQTSAAGTSWNTTPLSGTIQAGHYYLVQEGAGANTAAPPLPAPDASGSIAMGATSGKVLLTRNTTAATTNCPTGSSVADRVGYGTSTDCVTEWHGRTGNLSNTTAALRKNDGCIATGSGSDDFVVLAPNPRNSATPRKFCSQPPRPQSSATIVINELMGDPANAENASWGEWFEVHNYGSAPVDLSGWTIISDGTSQPDHTIGSSVVVPAGGYAVLGRGGDITRNGGVTLDYNYFTGTATTIWLDDADYLMLVDAAGARVDSVAWTSLPRGVTKALRDASATHADVDGGAWGYSTTTFGDGDYGTPDAANTPLADTPPFVSPNMIAVSGRVATDAPLPVGFESQLFATETDGAGAIVTTTFTWASLTPDIASVDERGVIHASAAGTARFRVVAADGAARNHTLQMVTPVASTTAQYLNNAAFGEPADADASDDFIVRRPQYTTSYNSNTGTPNWVAYDLNATDIQAGQDRCNCFTHDPMLPSGFTHLNTADYTGAGAFAGYGIDRGHMVRSFDRTTGSLDNAVTYYLDNVVPQASDLNQGPWANMENYLGDLAQTQNKEVYVLAGPAGSKGTVKNEGKIVIPKFTWKVAVILGRGEGLANADDYRDVQVIAVIMPNEPGVRNVDWTTYETTVNAVEALTGYDLLALLPDDVESVVESGMQEPVSIVDAAVAAGTISQGNGSSLDAKLQAAAARIEHGDAATALNQLNAFLNEVQAMLRSHRLDDAVAAALQAAAQHMIDSLSH